MNPTTLLSGLSAAITADPALGVASSAARGSAPDSGDLFLALVTGLLQTNTPAAGGTGQPAATTTPGDPTETPEPEVVEGTAPATPPVVTSGLTPTALPTASVPGDGDGDGDGDPATDESETAADGTQPAMVPVALAITPLVAPAVPSAPAATDTTSSVAGPATAAVSALTGSAQGQAGTDAGTGQSPDRDAAPAVAVAQPTTSTAPRGDAPVDAVPNQVTATSSAVGITQAAAPAAVATPAPTTADLPRVADQVFPEVLRASANAGTGTSRVTIKLNPESLGEVRVVLTHRGGELQVSLAAGSDARRALTDGAPELRRLLESVGRSDSRIVIRDLPSGPTPPAASASISALTGADARTDVSTDLAGGAWSGAGRPGGEPAPDREHGSRTHPGSTTATDGIPDATNPSRPITTTRRGHVSLDLSM